MSVDMGQVIVPAALCPESPPPTQPAASPTTPPRFAAFNQSRLVGADDLCAGSAAANSTCSGDSGGPLTCNGGLQVGVVSHGLFGEAAKEGAPGGCGSAGHLTTFASVAHFRPWIDGVLAEEGLL